MKRRILSVITICLMLCILAGCGAKPDFIFKSTKVVVYDDLGVVSDCWYGISGNRVVDINNRIEDLDSYYVSFEDDLDHWYETGSYTFNTSSADPKDWNLKDLEYTGYHRVDEDLLVKQLKKMDLTYTGDIYIYVSPFGEYTYIKVHCNVGEYFKETDYTCAIFKGEKKLSLPGGIRLRDFEDLCVLCE